MRLSLRWLLLLLSLLLPAALLLPYSFLLLLLAQRPQLPLHERRLEPLPLARLRRRPLLPPRRRRLPVRRRLVDHLVQQLQGRVQATQAVAGGGGEGGRLCFQLTKAGSHP